MPPATPRVQGSFVIYSEEFHAVLGDRPRLKELVATNAHEGPVYVRSLDALFFTTVPRSVNVPLAGFNEVSIGRFDVASRTLSMLRDVSNMANGMTLDREGRLLVCEQGTKTHRARISRIDLGIGAMSAIGATETVVDEWFGLTFNSPNDIVVKSDGTVWFTDPSYGFLQGFKDAPLVGDFVYRHDPATGETSVVADSFNKPNGLAFSPGEEILYINDSAAIQGPGTYYVNLPHHIRAFDVADGSHLVNDRLFAVVTPGIPDGLKTDSDGRVYSSCTTGVKVYSPAGRLLGEILVPGTANFCFGGAAGNTLFILNDTGIWAATLAARGAGITSA
jgi:gluconolactonase